MNEPTESQHVNPDEQTTGLPLIRTWRAVYWFVFAIFATWVLLLASLSRAFS